MQCSLFEYSEEDFETGIADIDTDIALAVATGVELTLADTPTLRGFVVGETVKVIDGPFNSFNAEREAIDEQKKKLKLMVKIFGRKPPLELNFMQVEKI